MRAKQITRVYVPRWRNCGLKATSHSRSYESHSCCGEQTSADDLIWFKFYVVDIGGAPGDTVKGCRICNGTESCVINFFPKYVVIDNKKRYIEKFAQIVGLCEDSDSRTKGLKNK